MKAKNKKEFLEQLSRELNRIGIEDTEEIFTDFEEHFADSAMQGISEEETAERLGDVKEIARSYLNLESSRINSIIARDVEHKKGVSLTKPGRSVPADLSLLKGKEAVDSDCVRSYTPEHISEEIYPNAPNGGDKSGSSFGSNVSFNGNSNVNSRVNSGINSGVNYSGAGGANGYAQGGEGVSAAGDQTVAGAFSNAGRAALDAAKITGHALADAFGQNGVKVAVIGAGKSAAEAVKTAGHSAAEAMRKAKDEHERQQAEQAARQAEHAARQADAVPRPNDSFRENVNNNRTGTIPPQYKKAKTGGGYKMIDASDMKVNINVGKFILALVLDCFVWSWLVPALGALIIGGCFGGALGLVGEAFTAIFGMSHYYEFYFLSRVFVTIGHLALALILVNIGIMLIKLFVKLFKFIINMHIRAIYDL